MGAGGYETPAPVLFPVGYRRPDGDIRLVFPYRAETAKKAVCIQNAVSNIVIQDTRRKIEYVNAYKSPFLIVLFI